ncbi:MAG: exo-alpha-sialidase [Actinomycetota bacterium]
MGRTARMSLVVVALVAVIGTLTGSAPPAPVRVRAIPLLGSPTTHPELPREALAASEFQALRTGEIDPAQAPEAILSAQVAASKIGQASGPLGRRWSELGPKPYQTSDKRYNDALFGTDGAAWGIVSGRATAVAIDPNDRSGHTIWLGTAGGGVWVTRDNGSQWKPVWDDKPAMAIGAIAFDKSRTKTMYVGTGEGNLGGGTMFRGVGVFRSTDDGRTFTRASKNVNANVITHIEARNGIVLVGTDRGLWRSADGGNSYSDVRLPTNAEATAPHRGLFGSVVTDVKIHPDHANEVTAAVGWPRGKLYSPGNGLYRSLKAGAAGSWTRMDITGLTQGSTSDDPIGRMTLAYATAQGQDHNVLWALVQDAGLLNGSLKQGAPPVQATALNGVYRSGDDGATWEIKATPQSFLAAPGSGIATSPNSYSPGVQAWYNQWLLVSPKNPDTILLGMEEVYQSVANAGAQKGLAAWQTIGRYWNQCTGLVNVDCALVPAGPYAGSTTHPDQHAGAISSDGTTLYTANDGGLFTEHNDAGTFSNQGWTSLNDSLGTTQPYYATIARDGTVYAGFQDNGTAKISPDGGSSEVFGGDGGDVAVDPDNSNNAFEEYVGAVVSVTKDGGKTWSVITPDVTSPQFIAPFKMDAKDANHVVLGAQQIVETTKGVNTICPNDFLVTGQHLSADVPVAGNVSACDWKTSYSLGKNGTVSYSTTAIDVDGSTIYAGFCGTCGLVSIDPTSDGKVRNGIATNYQKGCDPSPGKDTCWHHARAKGLPNRFVSGIKVDPANDAIVYATLAGYSRRWLPPTSRTKNVGRGHVFISTNGGDTFKDISRNLPDEPAESITVKKGRLFVGTHSGVYTAAAAGADWQRLGSGLPHTYAMNVRLSPDGDALVVATHGRGVWKYSFGGRSLSASVSAIGNQGRMGAHPAHSQAPVAAEEPLSVRGIAGRANAKPSSSIPIAFAMLLSVAMAGALVRRRRAVSTID